MPRFIAFLKRNRDMFTVLLCLLLYCILSAYIYIPCPVFWLTGVSCPGCGITRSLLSILRLDFVSAISYNPSIFWIIAITPVLMILYCKKQIKPMRMLILITAVIMIIVYMIRFLILHDPFLVFSPQNCALVRLLNLLYDILK